MDPVIEWRTNDVGAVILPTGESDDAFSDAHELVWTDGINEWREQHETLPLAVTRLAALIACVDGDRFFQTSPEQFTALAREFLDRT
jgi:hypothetical protein